MDISDEDPPADVIIYILHDTPYAVALTGGHLFKPGDEIRMMPLDNGGCAGASGTAPEGSVNGMRLDDEDTPLTIRLPGGHDGVEFLPYAMCLADVSSYDANDPSTLTDSDFNWLPYVQMIVSYQPPSAPPPSPPPPPPPSPPPPS